MLKMRRLHEEGRCRVVLAVFVRASCSHGWPCVHCAISIRPGAASTLLYEGVADATAKDVLALVEERGANSVFSGQIGCSQIPRDAAENFDTRCAKSGRWRRLGLW